MSFSTSRHGVPGAGRVRHYACVVTIAALWLLPVAWADEAAEPGDIKFVRQSAGMDDVPPAVFPHWIHRMGYTCYACHDAPFKMQAGANVVTMDQIQNGQSCGICHDGKTAFVSNLTTCNRCHH